VPIFNGSARRCGCSFGRKSGGGVGVAEFIGLL
jgi:hypothetical protein